jgi:hypothetical protein
LFSWEVGLILLIGKYIEKSWNLGIPNLHKSCVILINKKFNITELFPFNLASKMSQYDPRGYDGVITCPYNPCHQILRHRMQTHLVKCRKSYPDVVMQKCPFNAAHHIPQVEFRVCKQIIFFFESKLYEFIMSSNSIMLKRVWIEPRSKTTSITLKLVRQKPKMNRNNRWTRPFRSCRMKTMMVIIGMM